MRKREMYLDVVCFQRRCRENSSSSNDGCPKQDPGKFQHLTILSTLQSNCLSTLQSRLAIKCCSSDCPRLLVPTVLLSLVSHVPIWQFSNFFFHSYCPEDRVIVQLVPPGSPIMAETLHKVAEALHITDETKRISFENN